MSPQPPLAFITGASSGLGQALAWQASQAGYRLALLARRTDAVHDWARAQGLAADRYAVYAADVSDLDAMAAAGALCLEQQGLPDLVIANAGISVGMDTEDPADLLVMQRTLQTNVLGVAATFSLFLGGMRTRGSGQLVGVASVAGIRGLPGHGAYCASKAAVISYCESLRGECRGQGVQVITIVPGYIDTPLTRGNRYAMPFLMPADAFARRAFETIARGQSYRVIPWQMGVVAKLLRLLPNPLFDRLLSGRPRKRRQAR